MDAIGAEAKVGRAPVAAHASTAEAVTMAARAGVTTIEHGFEDFGGTEAIQSMRENGTIFVPTLSVLEQFLAAADLAPILAQTKAVFDADVKMACGGDTGAFAHGDNVREIELFLEAGIPLKDTLAAATIGGWEPCAGEWCGRGFGWVGEGCAADLVGVDVDVEGFVRDRGLRGKTVGFVMKDGRVWKRGGVGVGMI